MSIPIKNIYYLLSYAWNKLEEGERLKVDESDYEDAMELLANVLVNGCNQLFKRGLEHSYLEVTQEYAGIKGKLDFKETLRKNLLRDGKTVCRFDEFSLDNLPNQIIKASLLRLLSFDDLNSSLFTKIQECSRKFPGVKNINLNRQTFTQVHKARQTSLTTFLLSICKFIFDNSTLSEINGKLEFIDFLREPKAMANLFEHFIRNFFKIEQTEFTVRSETIQWDVEALRSDSLNTPSRYRDALFPKMLTDTTLESSRKKIVIETKYYEEALTGRFNVQKLQSSNLYQIYSYLRNLETSDSHPLNASCEGVLLYPTVDVTLHESYDVNGHVLRIMTIDLNQEWAHIKRSLLQICK